MRAAFLLTPILLACAAEPRVTVELRGPAGSGEPHLSATPDGRALLTWLEPSPEGGHALRASVRESGGWSAPVTVVRASDLFVNWADFPSGIVLADGSWLVHWLQKVAEDPYAYHVRVARSHDGGAAWSEPFTPHDDRSPTEHGFVSMVPWRNGAALVWLDGRAMAVDTGHAARGAMTLRATTISVDGTPTGDVLLDGRTCECCQTALVPTAGGLLAAYRDRSQAEIRDIAVVRFDGSGWSAPVPVAPDGWHFTACPVNGPQLAAAGDSVVVAWFTAAGGAPRVSLAFSTDGGGSFGPPVRVDDGLPRGRVDVVLLPGGDAIVVWLEAGERGAEVRGRRVGRDGALHRSWAVARTEDDRASGFPRIVSRDGELLVAWTVPGNAGGVRVASVQF